MRCTRLSLVIMLSFLLVWGVLYGTTYKILATSQLVPPPPAEAAVPLTDTVPATRFYTTQITIPTYPYSDYLTEVFTPTYNMTYTVLDWPTYNASTPTPTLQNYTLLVLKNDYLTVTVMPELGGRVYQIIDQATGQNHLYQNPVIKPTRWGPVEQGWWLAVGGIEWGLPVAEHGYEWGIPWQWTVVTSTAGITVTVRDTDAEDRLRAAINIHLPAAGAYLAVTPHLENPTATSIAYKFWSNAAIAPGAPNAPTADLHFIFNAAEMAVHSTGDERLLAPGTPTPSGPDQRFTWPEHNGVDFSRLGNWDEWLGFFEYPQAVDDFVGVYSTDLDVGLLRIFPHEVARGAKGFGYGWEAPISNENWTDDDSGSVEIHGGVAPTFWDEAFLEPGTTLAWTEFWYPLHEATGITQATEDGVLYVAAQDGQIYVEFHPTAAHPVSATTLHIWDRAACGAMLHQPLPALRPFTTYSLTHPAGGRALEQLSIVLEGAAGEVLLAHNDAGCQTFVPPAPHLGYGLNVRKLDRLDDLFAPLQFEWVKLWREYMPEDNNDMLMPPTHLPYKTLYLINCGVDDIKDPATWAAHVDQIVQAGLGIVDAYEICNETNVDDFWLGTESPPNPRRFAEMLCTAQARIRAIDPHAYIVSGGLAPVGRISGNAGGWPGNNGGAMDERTYLQALLDNGAGACIDALGYHPYGFAYPPEQDPHAVSNGFAFRGAEVMHDILVNNGYTDLPIWATEFNWIRRPEGDGWETCDENAEYEGAFRWQEVSAQTQADYLVRAYQYADRHWPWMGGMFVWNLDWHDYRVYASSPGGYIPCHHSHYYSLRRHDGTYLGAPTPAYTAVLTMDKRPGLWLPTALVITPTAQVLSFNLTAPRTQTATFDIQTGGYGTFTWTASVLPGSTFTPTLPLTTGAAGTALPVVIAPEDILIHLYPETTRFWSGDFTATLRVTTTPTEVLKGSQILTVGVQVRPEGARIYLPLVLQQPSTARGPHGPSKLGVHAIANGGTVDLVEMVHAGGGHVAVVKGLSFDYLEQVKQISPETVTIGRWTHYRWETIQAEGDVQEQAALYMHMHMEVWEPHQAYVDYWEILNEVDPPSIAGHVWLAEFFSAAMHIAEQNGYRLALFSYSMGVPEIYEWEAIADTGVFARAQQGGHILSLHEYANPMDARWGEALPLYPGQDPTDPSLPRYPDRGVLTGRYRHLYRDILIPRGEVIPLVITECNLGIDDPVERGKIFVAEMSWYDDRLREDDYVIGMTIFTLGGISWKHFDFYDFLPALAERIILLKDE